MTQRIDHETADSPDGSDDTGEVPERDPLLIAADRLADRLAAIDTGIGSLIEANRRSRRWILALSFVATAAVVSVMAVGYVVVQLQGTNATLRATNRCLTVVVAATSDRTGALAPVAATRTTADRAVNKARDDLLTLAIQQAPREDTIAASKRFVAAKAADDIANDEYDAAAAQNPPPPSPKDAC
jgi:hypothetical protein